MKIGLITEGAKDGADQAVCRHLIMLMKLPAVEVMCRPLGSLPDLKSDCGNTAALMLQEGCDQIVIIWDLYPGWRTDGKRPCLLEHRKEIIASLDEAKVNSKSVELVCIEEELEAWLLADHRALTRFIESKTVRENVRIGQQRQPERIDKPKTRLDNLVRKYWGRPYTDRVHARMIVEQLENLDYIRRSTTFQRFEERVRGKANK